MNGPLYFLYGKRNEKHKETGLFDITE